jgi:hypothetical protein
VLGVVDHRGRTTCRSRPRWLTATCARTSPSR